MLRQAGRYERVIGVHLAPRLVRHATMPVPPLPSAADADLQRSGAISTDVDPYSSRKLQGKGGAFRGKDVVPMWIADMDFRSPQPVVDAVVACAERGFWGYTNCPPGLTELALSRLSTVYGCVETPQPEWLSWLPGLVPGLSAAVRLPVPTLTLALTLTLTLTRPLPLP